MKLSFSSLLLPTSILIAADATAQVAPDGTTNTTVSADGNNFTIDRGDLDWLDNPIESEQTVAQACRIDRLTGKVSGLTVKGKGGIPPEPTEPMDSDAILVDGKLINLDPQVQSLDIKPIKTSIGDIYPARGVIVTDSGEVILTAYPTDNIDIRTPYISPNCS